MQRSLTFVDIADQSWLANRHNQYRYGQTSFVYISATQYYL